MHLGMQKEKCVYVCSYVDMCVKKWGWSLPAPWSHRLMCKGEMGKQHSTRSQPCKLMGTCIGAHIDTSTH